MFRIKPKRDNVIIDRLKRILQPTTFTIENISNENNSSVNVFTSEFVLPREALGEITEKHIKSVLASKMVNVLEENLEIEHTTDKMRQLEIFTAKLEVIRRSE